MLCASPHSTSALSSQHYDCFHWLLNISFPGPLNFLHCLRTSSFLIDCTAEMRLHTERASSRLHSHSIWGEGIWKLRLFFFSMFWGEAGVQSACCLWAGFRRGLPGGNGAELLGPWAILVVCRSPPEGCVGAQPVVTEEVLIDVEVIRALRRLCDCTPCVCQEAALPYDFPAFLTPSGRKRLHNSSHREIQIKTRTHPSSQELAAEPHLSACAWHSWGLLFSPPLPPLCLPTLCPGNLLPRCRGVKTCQFSVSPFPAFRVAETRLPAKLWLWISLLWFRK